MKHFLHLLALWKPPQHVVDGKLHAEQHYIKQVVVHHNAVRKQYEVDLEVWDAELGDILQFGHTFTEAIMSEKRGAFGYHLVTTLGRLHAEAKAAHSSTGAGKVFLP
jgi:hypothetical protein